MNPGDHIYLLNNDLSTCMLGQFRIQIDDKMRDDKLRLEGCVQRWPIDL